MDVYVTRDSGNNTHIEIYPAVIGIRKYEGCVYFGWIDNIGHRSAMWLPLKDCKYIFGFVPRKGTAWLVETIKGRQKKTRVDTEMEFS